MFQYFRNAINNSKPAKDYLQKRNLRPSFGGAGEALITKIEDIEQATEVLFESIVLKVDELDGSLRQFFERLKKYVKSENQDFILREVRQEFNISKTQIFRHIQILTELEYIKQVGGYANKGIKYKISYWDNYQKLRAEIKDFLMLQIQQLKQQNAPSKPRNKTLSTIVNETPRNTTGAQKSVYFSDYS
jgi:hypothetical protein